MSTLALGLPFLIADACAGSQVFLLKHAGGYCHDEASGSVAVAVAVTLPAYCTHYFLFSSGISLVI